MTDQPRIVAIADSDSYVKWAAATLDRLPASWQPSLAIIRTVGIPSGSQLAIATANTSIASARPEVVTRLGLGRFLRERRPDVLLVASTGPVAEVVLRTAMRSRHRPVLVSGLPGMSIPATARALQFRAAADVFVVHSGRERDDFLELGRSLGIEPLIVLNRLPFLRGAATARAVWDSTPVRRIVFAPQAKVPQTRAERESLMRALADLADRRRDIEVVVKLRARRGEPQTHTEVLGFEQLHGELTDHPGRGLVRLADGPMDGFLTPGTALVTVSSTAIFEALAKGLPAAVIGDFGVDDRNLTTVFEGSGLIGSMASLDTAIAHPDPTWAARNYLHDAEDELAPALARLLSRPGSGPTTRLRPVQSPRARLRTAARMVMPPRVWRRVSDTRGRATQPLRTLLGTGSRVSGAEHGTDDVSRP